jgi:hypothetical protein
MAIRSSIDKDFSVRVDDTVVIVRFWPTRTTFEFHRFTEQENILEFGLLSPDPKIRQEFRQRTRAYNCAEVLAMAWQRALAAVHALQ